jgi:hypothetical protein
LEDPGVDERIVLRWIFRNWDLGAWIISMTRIVGADGGQL